MEYGTRKSDLAKIDSSITVQVSLFCSSAMSWSDRWADHNRAVRYSA